MLEEQGLNPQLQLSLKEGEVRYFFCRAQRVDHVIRRLQQAGAYSSYLGQEVYALHVSEIGAVEAARRLRVTRVSG